MPTVRYTTVNGRVIAEKRGGVRKLYRPDHLGSTIALYDNTQAKTDTWVYWPYGAVRTRTGTTATPFQFVGVLGYFRDSSDRTYVRARVYRQTLGVWQTRDPLWPRQRPFLYVNGRPTHIVDPTGLRTRHSPVVEYFPGDDFLWKYGNYCGSDNVCRDNSLKPLDCTDAACQRHDDCLVAQNWFAANECHCQLMQDALFCSFLGCFLDPSPYGALHCIEAAQGILAVFPLICGATSITGGAIDVYNNLTIVAGWISEAIWAPFETGLNIGIILIYGYGIGDGAPLQNPQPTPGPHWDPGASNFIPGGQVQGRPWHTPIHR